MGAAYRTWAAQSLSEGGLMKETRIAFTRENRDKSRAGLKTQTRRVINPQPHKANAYIWARDGSCQVKFTTDVIPSVGMATLRQAQGKLGDWLSCPYGAPGDRLYMLEPYQIKVIGTNNVIGYYLDDNALFRVHLTLPECKRLEARKNPYLPTQARFMYRSLARTWFDVVDVRVERVQEISEADAMAELGAPIWAGPGPEPYARNLRIAFRELWTLINGHRSPWAQNDFVWAVSYKVVSA